MDRLRRIGAAPAPAQLFAALRAAAVIAIALAVPLGKDDHRGAFFIVIAAGAVYAVALAVRALAGRPQPPRLTAAIDVALLLALVALSGGPSSEARAALALYPAAMSLTYGPRAIAAVTGAALTAFAVVSAPSLGDPGATGQVVQTLVALALVGALGAAVAHASARRARQIEQLGADRASLLLDALDAEERERARIGERLHDDTLQTLLAAHQDVREARAGYLQSLEFADEALEASVRSLREIVRGLHPASLPERGLELALHVELDRVRRRSELAVDLRVDPAAVGLYDALMFAAARELIVNAVKHARASALAISLERRGDEIVLTVADDGVGIDAGRLRTAVESGHVGLESTRQRIAAAGGGLELETAADAGTTVCARVPVGILRRAAVSEGEDPGRIEALLATALLDSPAEESFDRLTRMAAKLLRAPISMLSLIDGDRQFLKSQVGLPEPFRTRRELPLTHSPCSAVVATGERLVVADASADPQLGEHPAVSELGMLAHASFPLATAAGHTIGAFSVADRVARAWSEDELEILDGLADLARREIEWAERAARARRNGEEVEAERRFIAAALESLGEGVLACDEQGELRIVNAVARRLVGTDDTLALGELIDRRELRRADGGEPVGRHELPLARALAGEAVGDEEYLAGDPSGEQRRLVLAGRPIADRNGARGAIMTIRDVTARRRAERASRDAERRFRVAFEHAPIGMAIVRPDGRFASVNVALTELVGRGADELRMTTLQSLMHPDDRRDHEGRLALLARGDTPVSVAERRFLHADGHEIWTTLHVALTGEAGQPGEDLLVQVEDVTERRREEERLRRLTDHDPATMLLNHDGFARELRRHAAQVGRYGTEGAVILLGVDGFADIRAALGQGGAEDVLRLAASALEARVRRSDIVARVGEERFGVLVPQGGEQEAITLADALLGQVASATAGEAPRIGRPVTVSVGAALFGRGAAEADTVLARAGAAMIAARRAGDGRAQLFGPSVVAASADRHGA